MKNWLRGAVAVIGVAAAMGASAQVTTQVFKTFVGSGDGTPFADLAGTLDTPGISFGTDTGFNWHPFNLAAFGSRSSGTLSVATSGSYNFDLQSDDGSALFIDGLRIIDNGNGHGPQTVSASTTLTAGKHAFAVNFFEDFGGQSGVNLSLPQGVNIAAVPEPASLALLAAGLGVLGLARRRSV